MQTLSYSQIDTWQQCPMRYKLQLIEQVPQLPQATFVLGDAVHAAIEQDNLGQLEGQPPLAVEALWEAAETRLLAEAGETLARELPELSARARAILAVYQRQVQPLFTPLAAEQSFAFPIPGQEDWEFAGRIDALVQDQEGRRLLVDYKTSRRVWSRGKEHTLQQATAYTWAMQVQEQPIAGVLYIPLISYVIAGVYTARMELRKTLRTAEEIAAYQALIDSVILEMREAEASGCYPAKVGEQCSWCTVVARCPALRSEAETPNTL